MLFNPIHDKTEWGDRVVVTGNHPALGNWNPFEGLDTQTSESMYPSWTTNTYLPAGTELEYKYVWLTADGKVKWEPGKNRKLTIPAHGRAVVIGGFYGNTTFSFTPRD